MNSIAAIALLLFGASGSLASGTDVGAEWIDIAVSTDGETRMAYQVIGDQVELQCTMGGRERWRRLLGLVPEHGFVTDDGAAVLTGTRKGRRSEQGRRQSYLVIAILDPHGQLLQYQHVMQRRRGCCRGPYKPYPQARGLIADAATDVAVIRVQGNILPGHEWWWLYRLSNGELMGDLHPWELVDADGEQGLRLRDVRLVPGRKLVATLWSTGACAGGFSASSGDQLTVIGLRGGTSVTRPLLGSDRSACAFITAVTRDGIQLRSLDGMPFVLAFSQEKGRPLQLTEE
ncbi:MAG: hypothetical protein ACI8QZ_003062 [Chlamydiales bacterium]|jgi:hypothetical protein